MNTINASIITIGDELLIGQTIDTNSAFIAGELNTIGVWVRRRVAVGDVKEDIRQALDEESLNSDIIIMTGGLGPTADDITKPLLSEYFGGKLVVNEKVLEHVNHLFQKVFNRPGPMLERNLNQALVPDNCIVLHNARGTAPGMWFRKPDTIYISLPGVPHEMKGLMKAEVIPRLLKEFQFPAIVHQTIFTAGQGESYIAELLKEFETSLPPTIKLAYLPNYGMVKLRLTSAGANKKTVEDTLMPYFNQLKELVSEFMVTDRDEGLEIVMGKILKEKNKSMGTAESCTGGNIAHLITSIPGSSQYYKGSVVCYSNESKENILGVSHETLLRHGAVSEETVKEMVKGTIKHLQVDYALATSGIMGPDGGTDEKPVGLVWIGVGSHDKIEARKFNFRFDRSRNIEMTSYTALNLLRKFVLAP